MPENPGDPVNILDFDFLKNRYDFELDRKDKLTAALTLPVDVLSGLGSLLAVIARSFTYRDPVLTRLLLLAFAASLLAFTACLLLLGGVYLAQARIGLFCLLAFAAFSGFPYVIDQVRFAMPTQQAPKPTQTQPAAAPQKPSFPENRVIKEGGNRRPSSISSARWQPTDEVN